MITEEYEEIQIVSESVLKDMVRSRDGYKCVDCGMTNDEHVAATGRVLDVHRLEPGSRYRDDGCVSVCRKCHGKRHSELASKRHFTNVKLSARAIQLARIVHAYETRGTIQELLSDIAEPELNAMIEKMGVVIPPDKPAPR